jgi:hypothetical protein
VWWCGACAAGGLRNPVGKRGWHKGSIVLGERFLSRGITCHVPEQVIELELLYGAGNMCTGNGLLLVGCADVVRLARQRLQELCTAREAMALNWRYWLQRKRLD